jgi:hypothetical protein
MLNSFFDPLDWENVAFSEFLSILVATKPVPSWQQLFLCGKMKQMKYNLSHQVTTSDSVFESSRVGPIARRPPSAQSTLNDRVILGDC